MTVSELIRKLQALPGDLPVIEPFSDLPGYQPKTDPRVIVVRDAAGSLQKAEPGDPQAFEAVEV